MLSRLNLLAEVYRQREKERERRREEERQRGGTGKKNGITKMDTNSMHVDFVDSMLRGIDIEFYVRFLTFWIKYTGPIDIGMPNGFSSTAVFHVIEIPRDPFNVNPDRKIFPTRPPFPLVLRNHAR